MTLSARTKTVILFTASQLPIAMLMVTFFRLPGIASLHRAVALITVVMEAVLMFELTGNIVQKVRVNSTGLTVRGVLERQHLRWENVKGLRQVVVSPMAAGLLKAPVKLFLIRTSETPKRLDEASEWWVRNGPLSHDRSSVGGLVKRYDAWVEKQLEGWHILWKIEYHKSQNPKEDARASYYALDGREKVIAEELLRQGKKNASKVQELEDLTYPGFVKAKGGRYAKEPGHIWETLME